MDNIKIQINNFAQDYFKQLDNGVDVNTLLSFFDDEFVITEGELVIDSKEMYAKWYEAVKANILNRKHKIEEIESKHARDNVYFAKMKMHFKAETPNNDKIDVIANIHWLLRLSDEGKLAISEYEIKP